MLPSHLAHGVACGKGSRIIGHFPGREAMIGVEHPNSHDGVSSPYPASTSCGLLDMVTGHPFPACLDALATGGRRPAMRASEYSDNVDAALALRQVRLPHRSRRCQDRVPHG